jgi:hypothetical protein
MVVPSGNVVQAYYRCRSTAGAQSTLDVGGRVLRNLRCDDKTHWQRNVPVAQGRSNSLTLGMHSGGSATLSVWGRP